MNVPTRMVPKVTLFNSYAKSVGLDRTIGYFYRRLYSACSVFVIPGWS